MHQWSNIVVVDSGGSLSSDVRLSLDAAGNAALVGRETSGNTSSVSYSHYQAGLGWEPVEQVAQSTDTLAVPDVAFNSDTVVSTWEKDGNGGSSEVWAAVRSQGSGWQSPVNVGSASADSSAPQVYVAPDGNAMVLWSSDGFEARRYAQSTGWDASSSVLSSVPPGPSLHTRAVTADDSETWSVVWSEPGTGLMMWQRDAVGNEGSGPISQVTSGDLALYPENGSGLGIYPEVQPNGDYLMLALYLNIESVDVYEDPIWPEIPNMGPGTVRDERVAQAGNYQSVAVWRQYDSSTGVYNLVASNLTYDYWTTPVELDNRPEDVLGGEATPAVGIDDNGNAIAVWAQSDGTAVRVWAANFYPATGWTAPMVLDDGDVNTSEVSFAMSTGGDAIVTWPRSNGTLVARHYLIPGAIGNQPPAAAAGPDQTVDEGDAVTLDGSASSDLDGSITDYTWVQTVGPAVTLSGADTASPGFTAPAVSTDTVLTFELTVTDDQGATDTDTVNVTVQDTSVDTTPPVTTATITSSISHHRQTFDITLSVNEPATTWFRVTGSFTITAGGSNTSAWQTYSGPIQVRKRTSNTATLEYYSIDTAGNQESTQSQELLSP